MNSESNDKNLEMIRRTSPLAIIFICIVFAFGGLATIVSGFMPARITCKTAEGVKNCIVKQYNLFGGETKTINNIVFAQSLRAGGVQRFPRCAIRLQNNDGNYIEFGDGLCLNFFRLQVVKDINLYLQRGGNFEGAYRDYVTALVGLFCLFLAGGLYKLRFGKEK